MKQLHHGGLRLSRRFCTLSAKLKYERFSYFLECCNCSDEESALVWQHVHAFDTGGDVHYPHVKPWFIAQEQMKRIAPPTDAQKGCLDIIPQLTAQPIWDKTQFEFVRELEGNVAVIQRELRRLIDGEERGFQAYSNGNGSDATDEGHWNVLYFFLHSLEFERNLRRFPDTMALLSRLGAHRLFRHALISCLAPQSHIVAHHGPSNKKLRVLLPLLVDPAPDSNVLRVAERCVVLREAHCVVFDDSFLHEASNRSAHKSRFALIFDVWHPDLSAREIAFLDLVQNAYERNLVHRAKNASDNNPYLAMLNAQHTGVPLKQVYSGWTQSD